MSREVILGGVLDIYKIFGSRTADKWQTRHFELTTSELSFKEVRLSHIV